MSVTSIVKLNNVGFGRKGLVLLTVLVLLLSTACAIPVSMGAPKTTTYKIGVIAPFGILGTSEEAWGYDYYDYDYDLYNYIVEPQINDYLSGLTNPKFQPNQVDFVVRSAGDGSMFLPALQQLHEEGVDIIIGGYWSGQAAEALDYIKEHGIVLISPASTDVSLVIPRDNLFRLVPDDYAMGKAIAAALKTQDIAHLVVIHCDNSWAAGLIDSISLFFDGDIDTVPYPEWLDYDGSSVYTEYVAAANSMLTGESTEGVLLLSYQPQIILQEAGSGPYPNIHNVKWFGSDATAISSYIRDYAGTEADHVKLYSMMPAVDSETTDTERFQMLKEVFEDFFGDKFSYYAACEVDAGWVATLSILELLESDAAITGVGVAKVLPKVASKYDGYSGVCELNKAGDRVPYKYEVWGYGFVDGVPDYVHFANYDYTSDTISWLGP